MNERASDIHIDDLGAPVLTPMQKMVLDGFAGVEVDFSPDAVLAEAQAQTGLSSFGPDDFRERLSVWCKAVGEDEELGPMGQVRFFGDMVRYASNRAERPVGPGSGTEPRRLSHRQVSPHGMARWERSPRPSPLYIPATSCPC